MEILITTVNFLILVGFILSLIFMFRFINKSNIKFKIIVFMTFGVILLAIFSFVFAWWVNTSNIILLKNYGGYVFNTDSNSYQVSYEKVLPKNLERVIALEKGIMGIGWPLKAVFMTFYFSPILIVVYFLNYFINRKRKI